MSKQILRQLLANGLSFKGEQAQIALQLNASNRGELRGKLFQLCGQQGRYRHLDPEGIERSAEIHRHRNRIRRCRHEIKLGNIDEKGTKEASGGAQTQELAMRVQANEL